MFDRALDDQEASTGTPYRSSTWALASILKGHPAFRDLGSWEAVAILDAALEPLGGWESLPDSDTFGNESDPRDSFITAWPSVKEPLHCKPTPAQAMPLVERWPLQSRRWPSPLDTDYRRVVSLCYWFAQLLDEGGGFFLSCRTAGELLNLKHTRAAAYLRRAARIDGPLKLIRKGTLGRASEYHFDVEAVQVTAQTR